MKKLEDIRRDYSKFKLDEHSIDNNPFKQFELWIDDATKSTLIEPTAFVLSTVNKEQRPSSRVLLLKSYNHKGLIFYTNYLSRKGIELGENPNASMLFFWDMFERQIRVEGKIEKLSASDSEQYFNSRPYSSRIGAWASHQSKVLKSRFTLMREVAKYVIKYPVHVPLPDFWGGYILIPDYFEFWQGRESRLHDRIRFIKEENNWKIDRLYP